MNVSGASAGLACRTSARHGSAPTVPAATGRLPSSAESQPRPSPASTGTGGKPPQVFFSVTGDPVGSSAAPAAATTEASIEEEAGAESAEELDEAGDSNEEEPVDERSEDRDDPDDERPSERRNPTRWLDALEKSYQTRFLALDRLLERLDATHDFLTQPIKVDSWKNFTNA